MHTPLRYVRCPQPACLTWVGTRLEDRQKGVPILCPICQSFIELPTVPRFKPARELARPISDLSLEAMRDWAVEMAAIGQSQNVAKTERLAKAIHVLCEATQQGYTAGGALNDALDMLRLRVTETMESLSLPAELVFETTGSRTNSPRLRSTADRLFRSLPLLAQLPVGQVHFSRAIDLELAETDPQREFDPHALFVIALAACAARALVQSTDASVQEARVQLATHFRRLSTLPCSGSRQINVILGHPSAWLNSPSSLEETLLAHQQQCPYPRHRARIVSSWPVLAQAGVLSFAQMVQCVELGAEQLDDDGLLYACRSLLETDAPLGRSTAERWQVLAVLLRIAARIQSAEKHAEVLQHIATFASKTKDSQPPGVFLSPRETPLVASVFAPRDPSNTEEVDACLHALSRLWRSIAPLVPQSFDLSWLASQYWPSLASAHHASSRTAERSQLLRRWAQLWDELWGALYLLAETSPDADRLRPLLYAIGKEREEARQRRMANAVIAAPPNPVLKRPLAPGWMSSVFLNHLLQVQDSHFAGVPARAVDDLKRTTDHLQRQPTHDRSWQTYQFLSNFARALGNAIPATTPLQQYARRAWLIESFELLQLAATEAEHRMAGRLEPGLSDRARLYLGHGNLPSGIDIEAQLMHANLAAVEMYPRVQSYLNDSVEAHLTKFFCANTRAKLDALFANPTLGFPSALRQTSCYRMLGDLAALWQGKPLPNAPAEYEQFWKPLALGLGKKGVQFRRWPAEAAALPDVAPVLLERVIGAMASCVAAQSWFGPPVNDLGDLLMLLRRDPGTGRHWHGDLYAGLPVQPLVSLITLARMVARVGQMIWSEQDKLDFIRSGEVERDALVAVRCAVCAAIAGWDQLPASQSLYTGFTCSLGDLFRVMDLPRPSNHDSSLDIYLPQRLLRLFSARERHSLRAHLARNNASANQPRCSAEYIQTRGCPRYVIWFVGTRLWPQIQRSGPVPMAHLLQHRSVAQHRIARLWCQFTVLTYEAGQLCAYDGHTGQGIPIDAEYIPATIRSESRAWSDLDVVYLFSFARTDSEYVENYYTRLIENSR